MNQAKFIKKKDCKMSKCKICLQSLQRNPDPDMKKQSGVIIRLSCKHEFHTFCIVKYHDYILRKYHGILPKNYNFKCASCKQNVEFNDCITFESLLKKYMSLKYFRRLMKSDYTGLIES